MKKFWSFLRHHLLEDFHAGHYTFTLALLALLMIVNYRFDFENSYLDNLKGVEKFFSFFLFYSIPYLLVCSSYIYFQNRSDLLRSKGFWITSIFALVLLSLDNSVPFLEPLIDRYCAPALQYWAFKVSINLVSYLTNFLPIVAFFLLFERQDHTCYGLKPKSFDVKPYLTLLAIVLPLLLLVSWQESFLKQYPMYKTSSAHHYLNVGEWVTISIYEFAYGINFLTVEYLFRGFFVIGIMHYMGRGAVLSMVVAYCMLHFGKPRLEALSSILGGYVLGVIAYETRSIWGGVILHISIAWFMEIIAYLQKV